MTTSQTASDPIAALWQTARAWLADALAAFGGPAAIAHAACDACKRRLALLESLVMKLLLIEATRLVAHSSPTCGGGRERSERQGGVRTRPSVSRCALDSSPQCGEHAEDPARSETWRVRFHTRVPRVARASTALPRNPRPSAVPNPIARARRLARRFEALRRVLADPRRAIAALVRKLAALGARAYAAALRIALFTPRGGGGMDHAHAIVHACFRSDVYRDSS